MKKKKRRIITKKSMSMEKLMSVLAIVFSGILVILGITTLILIQKPLKEKQDLRRDASVADGLVTTSFSTSTEFGVGQDSYIEISANTNELQTDGVQLVFDVLADDGVISSVTTEVLTSAGVQPALEQITAIDGGFRVGVIALPANIGGTFSSNTDTPFLRIHFHPSQPGQISLVFDQDQSISTVHGSNPPEDELKTVQNVSYDVVLNRCPDSCPDIEPPICPGGQIVPGDTDECGCETPGICVYPTPTPSPTPTPTPDVSPSPSPDVTYCNDTSECPSGYVCSATPPEGCPEGMACATAPFCREAEGISCTSNNNCYAGYMCADRACTAVSTASPTPTPTPTVTPSPSPSPTPDSGLSSCNESCDSHSDCEANHICYSGSNTCRLASNVSSTTCEEDNNDDGIARSCNEYCADTSECASGYFCFYNRCRVPENPDSTSCANVTTTTITYITNSCNTSCTSNDDCGANLRCYNNQCRLASNPGSSNCSPAPITIYRKYNYQVGSVAGTTKGADLTKELSDTDVTDYDANSIAKASPSPTPVMIADINDTEEMTQEELESQTALEAIIDNIRDRGIIFPIAMIASGLLLIALILFLIFSRRKSDSSKRIKPLYKPTPQDKQAMSSLEQRINQLQKNPAAPTQPSATPTQPINHSSVAPTPSVRSNPLVMNHPPQGTQPQTTVKPETTTINYPKPVEQPNNPTTPTSMVDRLKQKGINPQQPSGTIFDKNQE